MAMYGCVRERDQIRLKSEILWLCMAMYGCVHERQIKQAKSTILWLCMAMSERGLPNPIDTHNPPKQSSQHAREIMCTMCSLCVQ